MDFKVVEKGHLRFHVVKKADETLIGRVIGTSGQKDDGSRGLCWYMYPAEGVQMAGDVSPGDQAPTLHVGALSLWRDHDERPF